MKKILSTAIVALAALTAAADWNAGVEAYKAGNFTAAESNFQEVVGQSPDYPGAYYMLGVVQGQQKKSSQAVANLRKALELDPGNANYKLALGRELVTGNQLSEGFQILKGLNIASLPSNQRSSIALLFAHAATKTDNSGAAIEVIRQVLGSDANNYRLHQAIGVAYDDTGDDRRAFDSYKKAFDLKADPSTGRNAVRSGLRLARQASSSSARTNAYGTAAAVAEKLAGVTSDFEDQLLAGETLLGAKRYDQALGWFTKAASAKPMNALVHFYAGQCLSSMKRYDDSLGKLQSAMDAGPNADLKRRVYNQMGFVYAAKKDCQRAITMYENAGNQGGVAQAQKCQEASDQNALADAEQNAYEAELRKMEELKRQLEALENQGGG